ncbi:molybdate ABC transporter substrate-binding protein [Pseudokineococcus basanitobsidens]|uniref:Molybdate ABC transporter substrate-binding protein n=1 Tax=Pseudokineococcus basanitobsidens TaxID=1926649 RepID=A0ABU8RPK5_9ACTN
MSRRRPRALVGTALLPVALVLAGCGGPDAAPAGAGDAAATGASASGVTASGANASGDALTGTVTVFAAASLTEVFDELAATFEGQHPGVEVETSYAGSSDLATQITEGAPADVFASADERTMQEVVDAGLAGDEPQTFATNVLTVVTPPDDPAGIGTSADLARPGARVVVCAPQVPCGAATQRVEEATGLALAPVSEEGSVTDVLGKVTSGQADAGVVYVTDARRAGDDVREVPLDGADAAVNTYPLAPLADARDPETAAAFVDLVVSAEGQRVLADAGFGAPGGS